MSRVFNEGESSEDSSESDSNLDESGDNVSDLSSENEDTDVELDESSENVTVTNRERSSQETHTILDRILNIGSADKSDDERVDGPAEAEAEASQEDDPENRSNKGNNNKTNPKSSSGAPTWNGERLYPPARALSKKRSKAWLFGGFRKDKKTGVLITEATVCGFCGKEIKYRNTPTNLTQHLSCEHTLEYEGHIEAELNKNVTPIDQFFKRDQRKKISLYPPKAEEAEENFSRVDCLL